MIVTCEECNTRFNLDESLLKETGSKVRCSICKHIFVAHPEPVVSEPEVSSTPEESRQETLISESGDEQAETEIEEDLEGQFQTEDTAVDIPEADEEQEEPVVEIESDELEEVAKMFEMDEESEPEFEAESDASDLGIELEAPGEEEALDFSDEELDLSDMDDMLDIEPDSEPTADEEIGTTEEQELDQDLDLDDSLGEEAVDDGIEEELDLSDMEDTFEMEEVSEPEPVIDEEAGVAEELDLDIDLEGSEGAEEAGEDTEEELDLSDMEDMFEMKEEAEPILEEETEDTDGMDLDLDLELEDMGDEDQPEAETEEEIDLSDMEELLEADEEPESAEEPGAETLDDLDLELEATGDAEDETGESADEDLELSDLEGMLEVEGDSEEEEAPEEEQTIEDESLDLSDLEEMMEEGEAAEEQLEFIEDSADDMLALGETEVDDAKRAEESISIDDIQDTADSGEAQDLDAFDESEELEEDFLEDEDVAKPKKKQPISTPVKILLILVLLGGGIYVGIKNPYLAEIGSKIPFVGDFFKPPVEDPGNLKISTLGISGNFVTSTTAGKLFVITGKARNEYDHARGMIKVVGKLYSKGKKLEKSESVFCGNNFTEEELNTLDVETIKKQLKVRAGKKKSNMKIISGRVIPFMVVFSDLPENLDEYTIEVVNSFPALK